MTDETLTTDELCALIERVFVPGEDDRAIAVLTDLPDAATPDDAGWAARRALAADWARRLADAAPRTGRRARLWLYRNVRANNADLPATAWGHDGGPLPATAADLVPAAATPFAEVFAQHRLILAPTEFSTTAPLKLAARTHGFRAATMPGFLPSMIPALRLDWGAVDRRVRFLKGLLDAATGATLRWRVEGDERGGGGAHSLHLDLRHRTAHASGGLLREPGTAGNLPSGETYIVPYEGERTGDPSGSAGTIPVQFGADVVVYTIDGNRAVAVAGEGDAARREAERLRAEPAYGNLAELGLGVLADFGLAPTGTILLDEKLGLHVAFGRSDHFGGQVGAAQFSRPEAVVHIDRVYIPAIQPRVRVVAVTLDGPDGPVPIIRDDAYVVAFP